MKRVSFMFITVILLAVMMSTTAFAHGGHGRGNHHTAPQSGYAPCTLADCAIAHSHQHNGNWYCGQAGLAGDYEVCTVDGCTAIGLHEHDGAYYHCQNYGTGRCGGKNCLRRS